MRTQSAKSCLLRDRTGITAVEWAIVLALVAAGAAFLWFGPLRDRSHCLPRGYEFCQAGA